MRKPCPCNFIIGRKTDDIGQSGRGLCRLLWPFVDHPISDFYLDPNSPNNYGGQHPFAIFYGGESEIHSYKKLQPCEAMNEARVLDKLKFSLLACHQFFCRKHRPAINISYAMALMWVMLTMLLTVAMLAWRPLMRHRRPPYWPICLLRQRSGHGVSRHAK